MGRLAALLAAGIVLAGCGSAEEQAATVTVTRTETVTRTVTEPAAGGSTTASCSSARLSADLPDEELPAAVAAVRRQIAEAAVACDYDRLQELALESGEGFTYSYGAETSAADFWARAEERGEGVLAILVKSLGTRGHLYQGNWVWPSAYADAPTGADWAELDGIYPADEIASFREQGQFLGYRVGITPAGDWQFFVAGD